MSRLTELELNDLARRFSDASLPKQEWTHLAHLAVGLWHVERYGSEEALTKLRTGIRRLNDSHGTVNSPTSGYHETITRVYVVLLSAFAARFNDMSLTARLASLLNGPLSDRALLFKFYSRDRLMSPEARLNWVDPDIAPLSLDAAIQGPVA